MRRGFVRSLALGVVLACLAGRAYAQEGKGHSVGTDGLKIQGTVEGADDRVAVLRGDTRTRLPAKRYAVKLTGGTKYRLEMVSDDFDSFLVVQDQGGKQLAFDDDSGGNLNARLDFTAPADGTYKVFAASFKGTGRFTLTVRPLDGGGGGTAPPAAGKVYTLEQGDLKIEGKVEASDKEVLVRPDPRAPKSYPMRAKVYPVKMAGGAKYQFLMVSDEFDSFLVVQDQGGKQLAHNDDGGGNLNAKLDFTAPADGTYKVFAASFKGTGKFTLTVKQQGGAKEKKKASAGGGEAKAGKQEGPKGKEQMVGPGGLKIPGELSEADKRVEVTAGGMSVRLPAKMYLVQLKAGSKYRLEMVSPTLDSFLIVQDKEGKQLAFDDDSGGGTKGLDAKLDFTPPQTGTYKIFAASNAKKTEPGKFTLTVRLVGGGAGAGDGKVHEVGKDGLNLKGTLDATNQERTFMVKLAEGKTYVIDMVSPDPKALDPYLRLHDAEGKKLKEDDDSGGNLNARITFQAPATATYRIVATSFLNRGRGEFTLTVREK